ncbi:MAG: hypothetical protein ACRYFZ_19635 [Janthinobacterium lividum]
MKLSYPDFSAKWHDRFRPNTTFNIAEADFQEFALDIVDTFGVTIPNVPEYALGTTYAVGNLVRYTPLNGQESFYYALNAGQLTAPGPSNLTDWKVVPGPTTATALSQQITLVQAQGIDNDQVVAGRTYLIEVGLNAQGYLQTIAVRGVSNNAFDIEGTLEVNGVRTAVTDVNVQAGTWKAKGTVDAYTKMQADALLAGKQGAVTEQVDNAINGTSASLMRLNLGKYLRLITSQNTVVDLPPVTLTDVGQILVLYNYNGPGATATLTLQAKQGTDANATYLTKLPRTYVVLVEVVKIVRGNPFNDTVAGYAVLANSKVEPADTLPATTTTARPSQHQTFANLRLTSILFWNTLPASLLLATITNVARIAAQVNYQDPANPGVWLVVPARISASASTADLADLATGLLADMATVPAAALAIAAELQLLTYPLDSAQEAAFFLDGLGGGQYPARTGYFRTVYTGPPQGNLVQNSQFVDSSYWNSGDGSVGLSSNATVGNGQLVFTANNGYSYQRINIQPGTYELRVGVLNIDPGGSVRILAEIPAGATYGDVSYYGPGNYASYQFTWPGGTMQVRVIGTTNAVLGHLYLL